MTGLDNLKAAWSAGGALMPLLILASAAVWYWILVLSGHLRRRRAAALQAAIAETEGRDDRGFIDLPALRQLPPALRRRRFEALALDELAPVDREFQLLRVLVQLAPFLGLLGTVLGIIECLRHFDAATPAAGVGAGIAQALITTGAGIAAALPGVIALPLLRRRRDEVAALLRDLEMQLLPSATNRVERLKG